MGGHGSGGSNKKSIQQHLREGTYRADRHGPLPKSAKRKLKASKKSRVTKPPAKQPKTNPQTTTPIVCPVWFDDHAKAEFQRVCRVLHDQGTLKDVNHATLEGYCSAYSRAVRAEMELNDGFEDEITLYSKGGEPYTVMKKKSAVGIAEKAWGQVRMFAVELGITTTKGTPDSPEEGLSPLEKVLQAAERKPK